MWKKIENLPEEYQDSAKMFVAKAIDILPCWDSSFKYTTDPYTVWRTNGEYHCWPHKFLPTHYCEFPDEVEL